MSFDNVLFPVDIAYGSSGGPGFDTVITSTRSGAEQRTARREIPKRKWSVNHVQKNLILAAELREFYIARQGAANSFRYLDQAEYSTARYHVGTPAFDDEVLGTPDGSTTTFQIKKRFTSGNVTRTQNILLPVADTVVVGLDGVAISGWSVDDTTGIITFGTAPTGAVLTVGCEYHHHARFSEQIDDLMSFSYTNFDHIDVSAITIEEVIDELPAPTEFLRGGGYAGEISENYSLSTSNRAYALDPQSSGLEAQLPGPTNLDLGGPWFAIKNTSTTNDLMIKYDGTVVATLAPGATTSIWLFPGPTWEAL